MSETSGKEPAHACSGAYAGNTGLTKREYFAAMALQGLMADPKVQVGPAALMAVVAADQLIRELNKKEVRR